jgi:hypothetical protein
MRPSLPCPRTERNTPVLSAQAYRERARKARTGPGAKRQLTSTASGLICRPISRRLASHSLFSGAASAASSCSSAAIIRAFGFIVSTSASVAIPRSSALRRCFWRVAHLVGAPRFGNLLVRDRLVIAGCDGGRSRIGQLPNTAPMTRSNSMSMNSGNTPCSARPPAASRAFCCTVPVASRSSSNFSRYQLASCRMRQGLRPLSVYRPYLVPVSLRPWKTASHPSHPSQRLILLGFSSRHVTDHPHL